MVTPLEKFRIQYPAAALIADLVSTHDGQYVVRAAVVEKGETLATGLAASVDIQIAEDRARDRAIALLGISADLPTNGSNNVTAQKTIATQPSPAQSTTAPSRPPEPTAVVTPAAKPTSPTQTPTTPPAIEPDTALQFDLEDVPPLPPEEDFGPPIESIQEGNTFNNGSTTPTAITKPSAAAIALENFNTSMNPVDLSDVIAQTSLELTRLGWSNAQGREYLEKTYGKRSRQQLTDEELMSFLLYLEDQP